jgi:autotransporter-associated beta strand protein
MKATHLSWNYSRAMITAYGRIAALGLIVGFSPGVLRAGDVTWTGGASHGANPAYWKTAANWDASATPTNTDRAILGTGGSTNSYIEFDSAVMGVGSILLSSDLTGHNQILRSPSVNGTLDIYGLNGVLITNASSRQFQFTSSGGIPVRIRLAGSGAIGGGTATSTNLFYSSIGEVGGSFGFTKTGPNIMVINSNCTYSGGTTIAEGIIRLATDKGNLGTGPISFGGGTLVCGADRSAAAPLANSIVVTANSSIIGDGTSTTAARYLLFSGPFSGSAGTLTIDNKGVNNNTFVVRLSGSFTFDRPMIINSDTSTIGARAVLQLYNSATNGIQTFNGAISSASLGGGSIQRTGAAAAPAGTSIFTGDNSYTGGTVIDYGTILANNTSGSALGFGDVAVTNLGVLGGNGSILATATIYLGGKISPGSSATNIANLNLSALTLTNGATYLWQIASASGAAGSAWDLITVGSWSDAANSGSPITVKIDSQGVAPAGWDSAVARDWTIIQSSSYPSFNLSDFTINATSFAGSVAGVFGLYVDGAGSLHLTYTPTPDTVISVAAGSQTQAAAGHAFLTGSQGVTKIGNGELILDNFNNDYLGSTKVLAGTVSINVDAVNNTPGALGNSSAPVFVGDTAGNSNASFNINVDGVTMARNMIVQAGSSGAKTIGTTVTSGSASYLGSVTLQDNALLSSGGATTLFSGDFSGTGGLALAGSGTLTLSGIGSYAGPTLVTVPALNLNGPAFGTNTVTIATNIVLDNTGASLVILHDSPQVWNGDITFLGTADLALGAGPVALGGNHTVTVNNGTLVVGGAISGAGGLTKLGPGALSLASPTTNSYTGGTTNRQGVLVVNGTATFGDGSGTVLLAGGNVLCTSTHEAAPIANPVLMTSDTIIYGTNQVGPTFLPFSGPFHVSGATLKIGNKGWLGTVFGVRFQGPDNVDWPIIVGDPAFDRSGTTNILDFYNTTNMPAQMISGLITGPGVVRRGATVPNSGGTSIFTGLNTFTGGAQLISGALGFGVDSVSSGGVVTAGPIGTGLFTIGNQTTAEINMTVFAYGGARVIDNPIFLNGAQNVVVAGTNDLTFTGAINAGGIAKTWTVRNTGLTTLAGQITSNAGSDGAPLTKAGPGRLVLSADNLYTGATTVKEGALLVDTLVGSGTGTNTVNVQSAGTLGGNGHIAGRVSVASGKVSPGHSAGILTVGGGVNFSGSGKYVWDLAANSTGNPGTDFDVLAVTGGNVVLGGSSQIQINFSGSATVPNATNAFWQSPHSWTILTVGGMAANPGPTKFASILNGVYAAGSFTNTVDGSGNIVLAWDPTAKPPQPVLSDTVIGAGTPTQSVSWSSVLGAGYQVQGKTNLSQTNWLLLGDVTGAGTNSSLTLTNVLWPQLYYRVIITP